MEEAIVKTASTIFSIASHVKWKLSKDVRNVNSIRLSPSSKKIKLKKMDYSLIVGNAGVIKRERNQY
jgi:hypothetical protein